MVQNENRSAPTDESLSRLMADAKKCTTDGERFQVIRAAWQDLSIDWDYDSRELMRVLAAD